MEREISVVTVCRNAIDALEKTAASVNSQSCRDRLEFIIVDGASTDGTPALLEQMKRRRMVDTAVSEPDAGIYDAMNKGVAMATGRWIIFMNAGDTFADDTTAGRLLDSGILDGDKADVVYGDVVKEGTVVVAGEPRNCHRMFFCHQSCLARRSLLVETPLDTRHPMSADFKWVKTMIAQRRRLRHIDLPVACFDTTGVSNARRSAGLRDNMSIVMEMDRGLERLTHMAHLALPYIVSRLRGK